MNIVELNSRGYVLINNSLGIELVEKNADVRVPVASLTKMMTALVALEKMELNRVITITAEMLAGLEGFAKVGLRLGQVVAMEDLLYATMLPSAGDAAQALAISAGGNLSGFVDLMNQKAKEIGLENTHFNNAVGMDEDNYSTPRDMAKLVKVAMRNPEFVKVFESFTKELPTLKMTVKKTFDKIPGVRGGKTGFTNDAGRCLATVAEVEGTEYILVTVGAELGQNVEDARRVYQVVKDEYEPVRLVTEGEKIVRIATKGSPVEAVEFLADKTEVVSLENGTTEEDLEYAYDGIMEITREIEAGTKLGTYTIYQGENQLYKQEIYYDTKVDFYNYGWFGLGIGISAVCLVGLILSLVWVGRLKKKWRKVLPMGVLLALVMSLVVNVMVFGKWFDKNGETEVYQTEMMEVRKDEQGTDELEEQEEQEDKKGTVGEAEQGTEQKTDTVTQSGNCTLRYGNLMLINPNFRVDGGFIAGRRGELVSVSKLYGIPEYNSNNGDNLLMPEAAAKLAEMIRAYEAENPGHAMGTRSCFRAKGTSCGRLCAATGTSDHHTGLTCDLIDNAYGTSLDTNDYARHKEWQWLRENSYKYGFIDRFPEAWAGGLMTEPLNVDANGTTGLYETWHYRYVGIEAATEIATGKYNNGKYDSLEHYLKMTGKVTDLVGGGC